MKQQKLVFLTNTCLVEFDVKNLDGESSVLINPLHPIISMHILQTVLFIFPEMLTGRTF